MICTLFSIKSTLSLRYKKLFAFDVKIDMIIQDKTPEAPDRKCSTKRYGNRNGELKTI